MKQVLERNQTKDQYIEELESMLEVFESKFEKKQSESTTSFSERAFSFAKEKHKGQFRKDGVTEYFTHCEKVASLLGSCDDVEKAVAYCHDLLEDKRCDLLELTNAVGNADVIECVLALTRREDETFFSYIRRINSMRVEKRGYQIVRIKIADIVANLSDDPSESKVKQYNKALKILADCDEECIHD